MILFFLTIAIETIILFFLLRKRYDSMLIVRNSVLASSLTLPFVWFLFPLLPLSYSLQISLSETFAVGVETLIYFMFFKNLNFKEAFFLSLICNFISFSIGLLLT